MIPSLGCAPHAQNWVFFSKCPKYSLFVALFYYSDRRTQDHVNFYFDLSVPASHFKKKKVTFCQFFSRPGPCDPYVNNNNNYDNTLEHEKG